MLRGPVAVWVALAVALGESLAFGDYRTVHFDQVAPAKVKQFEDARRAFLAVLAEHHTTDGRARFFQCQGSLYLSLRPFASFGDLDARGERVRRALASVPPELQKIYDQRSDEALVPPHRNEIWRYQESLSYRPVTSAATEDSAGFAMLVFEELDPTPTGEGYEEAWGHLRDALKAARYPLTRLSFESVYGSGRMITLWLAHSREEFARTPSVEEVAQHTLGAAKANALLAKLKRSIVHQERKEAIPRPDLSSPPL